MALWPKWWFRNLTNCECKLIVSFPFPHLGVIGLKTSFSFLQFQRKLFSSSDLQLPAPKFTLCIPLLFLDSQCSSHNSSYHLSLSFSHQIPRPENFNRKYMISESYSCFSEFWVLNREANNGSNLITKTQTKLKSDTVLPKMQKVFLLSECKYIFSEVDQWKPESSICHQVGSFVFIFAFRNRILQRLQVSNMVKTKKKKSCNKDINIFHRILEFIQKADQTVEIPSELEVGRRKSGQRNKRDRQTFRGLWKETNDWIKTSPVENT